MIKIEIKGLAELIANTGKTRTMVKPLVATTLNLITLDIKDHAKRNAPEAFGNLKRSISNTVIKSKMQGIVWARRKYAIFVELGTRPHFPPIAPIYKWTKYVLHTVDKGVAYAVANKIARVGTEPQPFMAPAVEASELYMRQMFKNLATQLLLIMEK